MKLILCSGSEVDFLFISDRVKSEKLSEEIIIAANADEVIENVQEKEFCIVITDSLIASSVSSKSTDGVKFLLKEVKKKNQKCIVILYAVFAHDLDISLFNDYIQSIGKDSYEKLFKIIRQYYIVQKTI